MADTFTNDLRLRLQESGANSGQWGSLLNDTITNIASAFSLGSEAIPNASTHTITLADDSSSGDEARSLFLKCTGGGQACTVTLAPNTISKVWIISNETSFTLTFSAGSGANVAVAAGAVKVIVTDGAGSGSAVVDALSGLAITGSTATFTDDVSIGGITGSVSGTLKVKSNSSHHAIALEENSGNEAYSLGVVADGSLIFANSGTEVVRFDDSGQVGIGTSSPEYVLDVDDGTGNAYIAINRLTQSQGEVGYKLDGGTSGGDWFIYQKTSGDDLHFYRDADLVTFKTDGKVGIGTSSPAQKVHASSTGITFFRATGGSGNTGFDFGQHSNNNGYLWLRDNQNILIGVNNSEVARFDTSGNLGIGQSSPATKLDVNGGLHGDHATFSSVAGRGLKISTESRSGQNDGIGVLDAQDTEGTKGVLSLQCGGAEKLRVEDTRVMVGKSDAALTTTGIALATTGTATFSFDLTSENESFILNNNNSTGTTYKMDFRQNNSSKGQIVVGSSSTAYNTSSDYRLKENVTELTGATARLKQLTPKRFNFIAEPDITVDGFLAHEVSSIVPEAIDGEKDAVDDNGNPQYQGIDQSKLVPLLVATIQELEARITALEAE